jgi:hypothetical protein
VEGVGWGGSYGEVLLEGRGGGRGHCRRIVGWIGFLVEGTMLSLISEAWRSGENGFCGWNEWTVWWMGYGM